MTAKAALVVLAVGSSLVLGASPGRASADVTPPVLRAPIKASFVVGSQITTDANCFGGDSVKVLVHESFTWSGSDNSGWVRYDVVENTRGEGSYNVLANSTQTSFKTDSGTNWTNDCGGGSWHIRGWDVTAKDAAGNATTRTVGGGLIGLTQDTNYVDSPYGAPSAESTYAGAWTTSSCSCWSHGDTHKTLAQGASATTSVTVGPGTASHVGLVMAMGPDRGKFQVYVDGALKGTVDTYAATSQPRTIVWQAALAAGAHKVRIVNLATAGRPRIDLDAVLTN